MERKRIGHAKDVLVTLEPICFVSSFLLSVASARASGLQQKANSDKRQH